MIYAIMVLLALRPSLFYILLNKGYIQNVCSITTAIVLGKKKLIFILKI
jgi:hypothetical protein